jgi:RHS repeat-associated protein
MITERYTYSAYGSPKITDASGAVRTISAMDNRYFYTAREWDRSLNIHFFRARQMDYVGRFLSKDPIGYYGSDWNLYEFCRSTPVALLDPSGKKVEVCCRGTQICSPIDTANNCLGAKHCWTRTETIEVGMGPGGGGVPGNNYDCPSIGTTLNDHTGEGEKPGASCTTIPGCDEECINGSLSLGTPTGLWAPPFNDCNSVMADILKKCNCPNTCLKWRAVKHGMQCKTGILRRECVQWLENTMWHY